MSYVDSPSEIAHHFLRLSSELSPGQAEGPLALIRRVASNERSELWLATWDRAPDKRRTVSAKLFRPSVVADPAVRQRVLDAVRRAQRIQHPNVVPTLRALDAFGTLAITSEWVEGAALDRLLLPEDGVQTDPRVATWIAREIARTLADALAPEVTGLGPQSHGNLVPANLLVTPRGDLKISDFFVGSVLRDPAGASASDLEMTGLLLWSLLVGRRGAADRPGATFVQLGPVKGLRPDVPESLERVLARCFGIGEGFPDLRALERALARVLYADLQGDDRAYGRAALERAFATHAANTNVKDAAKTEDRAGAAKAEDRAAARAESDELDTERPPPSPPPSRSKGAFTLALEARDQPVVPQPLSADDHDPSISMALPPPVHPEPAVVLSGPAFPDPSEPTPVAGDAPPPSTSAPGSRRPPAAGPASPEPRAARPPAPAAHPGPPAPARQAPDPAATARSSARPPPLAPVYALRSPRAVRAAIFWFTIGFVSALLAIALGRAVTHEDDPRDPEVRPREPVAQPRTPGGE